MCAAMLMVSACDFGSGDEEASKNARNKVDAACMKDCAKAGGSDAQCKTRCDEREGEQEAGDCMQGCLKAGIPTDKCKERCDKQQQAKPFDPKACMKDCTARGIPTDKCKERCEAEEKTDNGPQKPR